ncbi:MAG: RNA polymerase Rpb4 family protein [Candidatus Diapherotrites archaeon]
MIGKKLNSIEAVPLFEVKEILKDRAEAGDLTYEQNVTNEYVKKFAKISKAKGAKLLEELKAIEGVEAKLAVKIADVLPADVDSMKLILPKNSSMSAETIEKIVETVKSFAK